MTNKQIAMLEELRDPLADGRSVAVAAFSPGRLLGATTRQSRSLRDQFLAHLGPHTQYRFVECLEDVTAADWVGHSAQDFGNGLGIKGRGLGGNPLHDPSAHGDGSVQAGEQEAKVLVLRVMVQYLLEQSPLARTIHGGQATERAIV